MRYLITGGAGFIGSHLIDGLTAQGNQALVLDDLSIGSRANIEHHLGSGQVELVEGSVCDADLVDDCMRAVDRCVHLASVVGVQLIVERPLDSLLRNVRGTDNVLGAAERHGRWLLFSSTSEIYGKNSTGALNEHSDRLLGSPFVGRWSYAIAKAFGEALVNGYCRERDADMVVVRLFNTVGPRQTGRYGMVLPRFVRQALAEEELTVFGNGMQSRCFIHVHDTVAALLSLCESPEAVGSPYNIGVTTETPVIELARRVIERTGSNSTIRLVPYEDVYGDGFEELGRRKPDTASIERLTGWYPTRSLDQAIDDVVSYERTKREDAHELPFAPTLEYVRAA